MDAERTKVTQLQAQMTITRNQELNQRREIDSMIEELDTMRKKHAREVMDLEMDMRKKDRENRELQEDLKCCRSDLARERESVSQLKATVASQSTADLTKAAQMHALQAQLSALQSTYSTALSQIAQLQLEVETVQKEKERLRNEVIDGEMVRRKLHNTIQELKGNIRVFCRVRPALAANEEVAAITFPDPLDHKEIVVASSSESAMGNERKETWNFTFDKVFEPPSTQAEVFEEISHLAQSCVDGYNVCIFAYGQTGSGKSFTMEGGITDSTAGMIPRAVEQVFRVAEDLKSKGWEYKMEGQFLEIYNETINDLLGHGELDKKKHEIRHDAKNGTRVTDVNVVPLRSPSQVRTLLAAAQSRRTVAATLMNERSSRSHSVFTLRISGTNAQNGERCEGCLNLVDLAGSERLNASGAAGDKDRLRETQNINKSLSALGDVIAALGERGASGDAAKHIPYRNSKARSPNVASLPHIDSLVQLTYLLMNSLSGNSKTLMILNLSPLAAHLNESLCSLRFATKVNNTMLGTARKQLRN
ncbi:C-terminal kinesin [Punctularia strigosozonata HHB-11173 SS5]|uniref:C-terminal kinesin n=1 Tax=Punctularia strigosozonata (strain HHB-11173) TaxID=741275 RepID=UPI000441647C|nr:C-terminal kinesin [Punctularia strigosozonata HHB-11173 SS5]EIN09479.1 C-terminal kinesin [Punctularia strigosozonata HHB-11173 SS5]